ncbi:MAG: hypothetical protein HXS53_11000, partial [Theionarchaea archaeon]|nr:hypothetical protein [Theionarchaea archaeon]
GLILGIGIGLLICGFMAGNMVQDYEYTLDKYERHIDNFYEFTHSYGFVAIQGLVSQTATMYKSNPLLRQALETVGMGELGQLFEDLDGNFEEILEMSEDLSDARSSVQSASTQTFYLKIGGIIFIVAGIIISMWGFRESA